MLDYRLKDIRSFGQPQTKYMVFAYRYVVAVADQLNVKIVEKLYGEYESASQAKLNKHKSVGMRLSGKKFNPPSGMLVKEDPIRHLGVLLARGSSQDQRMEEVLLEGIHPKIKSWGGIDASVLGRVVLINVFVISRIVFLAHYVPFSKSFFHRLEVVIQR